MCYTAKKLPLRFIGALTVMLVISLQVSITQYYMMYRKANITLHSATYTLTLNHLCL